MTPYQESAVVDAAPPVGPELPNVELTSEVLHDLFLAEIALQRSQFSIAVANYRRLALETRDPRLVDRATRIAVFAREYQDALELGRLWVELDPDNLDAGQILTALLVKTGDYDAALEAMEQVLGRGAANEDERYILIIRLLGREQDKEGALEVVDRFLQKHPGDTAALYAKSQLALRAGKIDQAEQAVDNLLAEKQDWTPAVILRTRILQSTERGAEGIAYLGEVLKRQPKNTEVRIAYGRLLVDVGRTEESLEQFRKVLKAEPDNEEILFAAGLVALRLELLDEAEGYFFSLYERSARLDDATYYLGRIAEFNNDNEAAIRWYTKVQQGENFLNAQARSALLLAQQGDVVGARARLHTAKARSPDQKGRFYLIEGEILREVERYEDAMELYNAALEELPENNELLYARAMVAEKLDRIDLLEKDLLKVLEREPDHVDALNSLGYTLADRTGRHDEAYEYVKRALDLRPDSFYILDSMGWVLYRQGRLEEALKYLQQAMELSDDSEIAAHLGEVLWVMGDHNGARNIWNKALKLSPESSPVLNTIKRLEQ